MDKNSNQHYKTTAVNNLLITSDNKNKKGNYISLLLTFIHLFFLLAIRNIKDKNVFK